MRSVTLNLLHDRRQRMLGASATVLLVGAIIGGAGLGWLVASRRHPAYILAFCFLVLGAGLVIASLPSYLFDTGMWGQDPGNVLAPQIWASRISWVLGAASVAFALTAGLRALWAAPQQPAAGRSSQSATRTPTPQP
jgi:ABC-type xylose transport system permease subunit